MWVASNQGAVKLVFPNQKPVFFVKSVDLADAAEILHNENLTFNSKALELHTFKQRTIAALYFESLASFYQARKLLTEAKVIHYESSVRLEERFLMERFIYGSIRFERTGLNPSKPFEIMSPQIRPANKALQTKQSTAKNTALKIVSIDIECSENGELFSIGYYSNAPEYSNKKVMMIGAPQNDADSDYIEWIDNEKKLLERFVEYINHIDPDIIIGWNVINFDCRVLCRRALKHQVKMAIGRGNTLMKWRDDRFDNSLGYLDLEGRVVIDGISALKSQAFQFPSFSLQAMAEHFLGESKAIENVDSRLETIIHDFKFNKTKLAKYNLKDCELVWDIFEKAKLLEFLVLRGKLTGLELDRAGGSVAAFNNLYLPKVHRGGYVSPNLPENGGLTSPGGYVMNSIPGLYKNVIVLDFKSLYPSIIRTFKIDPMGLAEGLKHKDDPEADLIPGYKGAWFHRTSHILPDIINRLWQQRDEAKLAKDSARSQAIKILMNSFYGVLGSGGCPFYDPRLASSITMRGHWIMKQTAEWIEAEGYTVIYGDTDSTFVLLGDDCNSKEANKIGRYLQDKINNSWINKIEKDFAIESCLEMEFETHFSRFLMPTIRGSEMGSKKRYAGLIEDPGGKRVVFKGLENVRTDWTKAARKFQEVLYGLVFDDKDPSDYIIEMVNAIKQGKVDSKLIYRKRLRKPLSSYIKNVPPHVKAAKLADQYLVKHGKKPRYHNKGWIEYVITIAGPQPLENINAPIDYQHYIDKQIAPVAEAILPFIGLDFEEITSSQMGLF